MDRREPPDTQHATSDAHQPHHWPSSRRSLWMPLVVVIAALIVLVAVPIVVGGRVRHIRSSVSDVVDQARDLTSDIEAALAREVIDAGAYAAPSDSATRGYLAAVGDEHDRAVALGRLVERLGPELVEPFAAYREATGRWHEEVERGGSASAATNAAVRGAAASQALDAALRLDAMLARDRNVMLQRARTLEEVDVLLPLALVPIAILGCVLALRAGRRTATLAEEAESGRRELRRVLDERAALMRGITHDLKNPLGAALGFVELIQDEQLSAGERENALRRVRRLLRTSLDTVAGLLDLARSDVGSVDFERVPVDLVALARSCAEDQEETARQRGLTVSVVDPPAAVVAQGDPPRVRAAAENLLSNALKYTPANGHVTVRVARRYQEGRDFAVLTVADTGPGIPTELRERVFEEFFRVPALSHVASGTGIGLAVSRRVARMMGGDIRIEDSTDDTPGTTISLWLPTASPDDIRSLAPKEPRERRGQQGMDNPRASMQL